jgi:hypothetical protein
MNQKTTIKAIMLATIMAASAVVMALPWESVEASSGNANARGGDATGGEGGAATGGNGGDATSRARSGDATSEGGTIGPIPIPGGSATSGSATSGDATGGAGGAATGGAGGGATGGNGGTATGGNVESTPGP